MNTREAVKNLIGACVEPQKWIVKPENRDKPMEEMWRICRRGDWLLWLAARVGVKKNSLVLAACDCAYHAVSFVESEEESVRICALIDSARDGDWDRKELRVLSLVGGADALPSKHADQSARAAIFTASELPPVLSTPAAIYAACVANAAKYAGYAARANCLSVESSRTEALAECARIVRADIEWCEIEYALYSLKGKL